MVIREPGSGSLEVILSALKNAGICLTDLNIELQLENIESIKSYLLSSHAFAFLSIHSIFKELKAGELKIIDIKNLNIERFFYFITQQGDVHHLHEIFYNHLSQR